MIMSIFIEEPTCMCKFYYSIWNFNAQSTAVVTILALNNPLRMSATDRDQRVTHRAIKSYHNISANFRVENDEFSC